MNESSDQLTQSNSQNILNNIIKEPFYRLYLSLDYIKFCSPIFFFKELNAIKIAVTLSKDFLCKEVARTLFTADPANACNDYSFVGYPIASLTS